MKKTRALTLVSAALVAGLALGSVGIAVAAPATSADGTAQGIGLRMGEAIHDAGARLIDILVDLTGLDVADIADRRADGETVADIAESEGVSTDELVGTALDVRETILDEKVAEGVLDAEDKDVILQNMTDRLSERLTSTETGPFGGRGGGMGGARGGGGGYGMADGTCLAGQ